MVSFKNHFLLPPGHGVTNSPSSRGLVFSFLAFCSFLWIRVHIPVQDLVRFLRSVKVNQQILPVNVILHRILSFKQWFPWTCFIRKKLGLLHIGQYNNISLGRWSKVIRFKSLLSGRTAYHSPSPDHGSSYERTLGYINTISPYKVYLSLHWFSRQSILILVRSFSLWFALLARLTRCCHAFLYKVDLLYVLNYHGSNTRRLSYERLDRRLFLYAQQFKIQVNAVSWKRRIECELINTLRMRYSTGISSVFCEEKILYDVELDKLKTFPIIAKQQCIDTIIVAQEFFEKRTQTEREIMQRLMERWRTRHRLVLVFILILRGH